MNELAWLALAIFVTAYMVGAIVLLGIGLERSSGDEGTPDNG